MTGNSRSFISIKSLFIGGIMSIVVVVYLRDFPIAFIIVTGLASLTGLFSPLDSVLFFSRVYVYVIPGLNNHSFINALSIQTRTASSVIVINRPAAQ